MDSQVKHIARLNLSSGPRHTAHQLATLKRLDCRLPATHELLHRLKPSMVSLRSTRACRSPAKLKVNHTQVSSHRCSTNNSMLPNKPMDMHEVQAACSCVYVTKCFLEAVSFPSTIQRIRDAW